MRNASTAGVSKVLKLAVALFSVVMIFTLILEIENVVIMFSATIAGCCFTLYSPVTQIRVSVEAGTGVVSGDRARLLEFQLEP